MLTADTMTTALIAPVGAGKSHTVGEFARLWTTFTGRRGHRAVHVYERGPGPAAGTGRRGRRTGRVVQHRGVPIAAWPRIGRRVTVTDCHQQIATTSLQSEHIADSVLSSACQGVGCLAYRTFRFGRLQGRASCRARTGACGPGMIAAGLVQASSPRARCTARFVACSSAASPGRRGAAPLGPGRRSGRAWSTAAPGGRRPPSGPAVSLAGRRSCGVTC